MENALLNNPALGNAPEATNDENGKALPLPVYHRGPTVGWPVGTVNHKVSLQEMNQASIRAIIPAAGPQLDNQAHPSQPAAMPTTGANVPVSTPVPEGGFGFNPNANANSPEGTAPPGSPPQGGQVPVAHFGTSTPGESGAPTLVQSTEAGQAPGANGPGNIPAVTANGSAWGAPVNTAGEGSK
jgi:hypothetical protein